MEGEKIRVKGKETYLAAIPRLRLVEDLEFLAMPELVARLSRTWFTRAMYGTVVRLPFYRRLVHHVRYEFP